jgi:leucine dehydrogenase
MYESMMLVHVNQGFASEQLSVSNHPAYDGHEQVVCGSDAASGMRAIIAVHSTRRGAALGGCRMWPYEDTNEALTDVRDAYVASVCDRFGATAVRPDAIYDVEADVFAPCALGSVLSPSSVNRLKAGIVAGSANNQLASPDVAHLLHDCGILYAPDYVINAGGVINISYERETYDNARAAAHVSRIGEQLTDIFHRARLEDTNTAAIADEIAQRKLQAAEADV